MNFDHSYPFLGDSMLDMVGVELPQPKPKRRPWLAAVLLVLAGCVLAGPREDSAAVTAFKVMVREAVQIDSAGRYHDSLGRAMRTEAVGVQNAATRQLLRTLNLQPGDSIRPDLTVVRKGPSK